MDRVIVMGASQGGVAAFRSIVRDLPRDFAAPILAVQHVGPESLLPSLLNEIGGVPASHARDGEAIRAGHMLIAPPDHHMLVSDGHIQLTRGPRENWARPALDPLFRTAAADFGEAVVGVVLTGRLNDGVAGLFEVKRHGGVTIVQDPDDAEAPSMPRNALLNVAVDHSLPLRRIPDCLVRLVEEAKRRPAALGGRSGATTSAERPVERPVTQTCPECGGAMRQEGLGSLLRFRCHIGHVMSAEVVAAAQAMLLESQLSASLRLLNEHVNLCRDMADREKARGAMSAGAAWERAAEQAARREGILRTLVEAEPRPPEALPEAPL